MFHNSVGAFRRKADYKNESLQRKNNTFFRAAVELAAPHTWPAATLPVLLGTVLACGNHYAVNAWTAFCVMAVAVLLQSAVNTLNDYRDFMSGLDTAENCSDPTDAALIYSGVTPGAAMILGLSFFVCAAVPGGLLILKCGPQLLLYGGIAMAAVLLYVLPGISFSAFPLGEALSGIAMGGVLPCAAYHAVAGSFEPRLLFLCLPSVVSIGCIMLVNNTSDIEKDKSGGRRTFPVCLGRERSETLLRFALIAVAISIAVITIVCYSSGTPALLTALTGLIVNRSVRRLFQMGITPERRKENMIGVLSANKWMLGCYIAAVGLSALKFR